MWGMPQPGINHRHLLVGQQISQAWSVNLYVSNLRYWWCTSWLLLSLMATAIGDWLLSSCPPTARLHSWPMMPLQFSISSLESPTRSSCYQSFKQILSWDLFKKMCLCCPLSVVNYVTGMDTHFVGVSQVVTHWRKVSRNLSTLFDSGVFRFWMIDRKFLCLHLYWD